MTDRQLLKCLTDRPCTVCKFHTDAGCERWSCVFEEQPDDTKNKGDLISRQAVFDELEKWDWQDLYLPIHFKQILDDIPSVENKGEWIKIQSGGKDFPESIVCSKCKNENSHLDFNEHAEPIGKVFVTSKFCPNCGARMKGSE